MSKNTSPAKAVEAQQQGVIVPIDVEALCVGTNNKERFEQTPFNFAELNKAPYLSSTIENDGTTAMQPGVHLHWALPDAITQGKETGGKLKFPAAPDRWLITRIFCDAEKKVLPQFDRWIIESNFYSPEDPNGKRESTAIPYQGKDWESQPWRHLGKVSSFDTWIRENAMLLKGSTDSYLSAISAVGYGVPDFAAAYYNAQNVFGFHDLGTDLEKLGGTAGDKYVSYHILGWYSNPAEDPIRQLPQAIRISAFDALLEKITNPDDRNFVTASFRVTTYALDENVTMAAGDDLWDILRKADFPLQIDIPTEISPDKFDIVLSRTPDAGDKATLKRWYLKVMGPDTDLDDETKIRAWNIMAAAGFDFVNALMTRAAWSLPSGTAVPSVSPAFTVYSGLVSNVRWNKTENFFKERPGQTFNIAIGNTPEQALSALAANTSGFPEKNVELVEEILNALQSGLLDNVKDESIFSDWEELKAKLHQDTFSSDYGGLLYEVKLTKETPESPGEVTLDETLAHQLNELNAVQQFVNEMADRLKSVRAQVFTDWYRFMLVYHAKMGPLNTIQAADLAEYIAERIARLNKMVEETNIAAVLVREKEAALGNALGTSLFLAKITAPRYWAPNDPVLLFQGDGINPSDRYGNDGRYMYNDTLLCRLSYQLITNLVVPAGAFGNAQEVKMDRSIFPVIPNPHQLPVLDCLNAVTVDAGLLNEDVVAEVLRKADVVTPLPELAKAIGVEQMAYLDPAVPAELTVSQFDSIVDRIYAADAAFFRTMYTKDGDLYRIKSGMLKNDERLHLVYIFISVATNPAKEKLDYTGITFSQVGLQAWEKNPWLPFTLKWRVSYFPLQHVTPGKGPYPEDFITSKFKIGDTDLVYTGPPVTFDKEKYAFYNNTIFLTPHANINLRKQLRQFIDHYPYEDQLKKDLEEIYSKLVDKPVLSQALSGLNEAFLMLQNILQLPVADPAATGHYIDFTNDLVKGAVQNYNSDKPVPDNYYNPIRTGLMKIDEITIVDVFGRNITVAPDFIFRASDMKQSQWKPDQIYFAPRLVDDARLQFRWLSANSDEVEMNTHPATTPICGWILANHLDSSLWVYDNKGNPYGSLILNYNDTAIIWQCAPGSPYFGLKLDEFFTELGVANKHMEQFVRALYGKGDQPAAAYLRAFMKGLDDAAVTIEPSNFHQYQSTAVLMGKPYALVRASIDLQLMGDPSYNTSWQDLELQVNKFIDSGDFIPGNDYGMTKVKFPVKIGNIPHTEDGLAGYFKGDDYTTFYCPAVRTPSDHVFPPKDDNLVVTCARNAAPVVISMLIEPRGKIHASTGILPVKAIDIPPDQYLDALQKLQLSFLTSPVLTPKGRLSMPLPATEGGAWAWIGNEGNAWSADQKIEPVIVDAVMDFNSQNILEGWLNLSSRVLNTGSFKLENSITKTAALLITEDPAVNKLSFRFTNNTGMPLKLAGGAPVYGSLRNGGSSFAFNFGDMLPDTILSKMKITAANWNIRYFPKNADEPPAWAIAPVNDMSLKPGETLTFTLENITCPATTHPGNFTIAYYNLPEIPDSISPVLLPVAVQAVPQSMSHTAKL